MFLFFCNVYFSMIRQLKLRNFRGIKEGEIELSNLTILVGSNNSGKTTILEALFLLPNPLRDVPYADWSAVRTVHHLHETLDCEGYAFLLYNYLADEVVIEWDDGNYLKFVKHKDSIYLNTNIRSIPQRKQITVDTFFGDTDTTEDDLSYFGKIGVLNLSESYEITDAINRTILTKSYILAQNSLLFSSQLIKPAQIYLKNNWANIMNLGITKIVADEISKLVNEEFIDITIEPWLGGKLSIYGFKKDGVRIRLGDLGAGSQAYIIARMLYEIVKPEILLWDDVEAHMNPRMLIRVAEWFADLVDEGKQVVVATHSLDAVRTIASLNEEVARIYLTSVENGILNTKALTLDDVEELLKAGIDIRLAESVIL